MTFKTFDEVQAYWDSIGCKHKQRKVVCAAVRHKEIKEVVICSARHFDALMRSIINLTEWTHHDFREQGFVDQWGIYMSREEARAVAIEYGVEPDLKNTLFSEDLY